MRTPTSLERLLLQRGTMVIKREYAWLKLKGRKSKGRRSDCFLYIQKTNYNSTAIR